jgi:hypothetical protein
LPAAKVCADCLLQRPQYWSIDLVRGLKLYGLVMADVQDYPIIEQGESILVRVSNIIRTSSISNYRAVRFDRYSPSDFPQERQSVNEPDAKGNTTAKRIAIYWLY